MFKIKPVKILCLYLCVSASLAFAGVYVEVTGGQVGGLPIAIVPFSASKNNLKNDNFVDLAQVIQYDLQGSGQFKPIPRPRMEHFPSKSAQVTIPDWQKFKINNLVLGTVIQTNQDYQVEFELLDIIKISSSKIPNKLLSLKFEHIPESQLRALAHHISDLIFEKLTGIKGNFSTRIAYVSVQDVGRQTFYTLEVADQDGFNAKPLQRSSFPLMSPAWSPDGKKLAFVSFDKNRAQINIVEVSTGKVEQVSNYPGINGAPNWSKDGQNLALVLSKDGSPKIYILNLKTKKLDLITHGNTIDTEPCFMPDGESILFTSNRGGKAQIYKVNLVTQKIERVTYKGLYNARASVSADGTKIVFMHRAEEGGAFSIAVQNLGTHQLSVLTQANLDESPTLAPNGMMVMYSSQEGTLGVVSIDGRIKLRLPARDGIVQEPAWSPFLGN